MKDWRIHRASPNTWSPATGSTAAPIPNQWLDGSDTTTIDKAGPVPITNGATVLEWRTKAGTLRKYRLIGPNAAPIWESNVIGSLGGVKFVVTAGVGKILSADVLTGMRGLTGRTTMIAARMGTNPGGTKFGFAVTETHITGSADGVQHSVHVHSFYESVTKRQQGDTQAITIPFLADNTNGVPVANGQVIVETATINFTAGSTFVYNNGCLPLQFHSSATNTGTTDAARDPYAMSVGAILQETGGLGPNTANGFMDGHIFEILDWFTFMTPDQLVEPHDYLCNRWGGGLM